LRKCVTADLVIVIPAKEGIHWRFGKLGSPAFAGVGRHTPIG
jgi:hypothetical protein